MTFIGSTKPKIAVITLIQEGAAKIGGEHAMLFPYVEQAIKAAKTVEDTLEIIPYVISPRPKKIEVLPQVEKLKESMAETNNGKMILVSNGVANPYSDPWNWERYGYEANKVMIRIFKERNLSGIIIMAHGFASIPAILDMKTSQDNGEYGNIPISCYYITHSSFEEHKDNRSQRRMLEREIQNHAKMIAISPYMANHLEQIGLIDDSKNAIPLYNALPENGWFSIKVPNEVITEMINERNEKINQGPFYGVPLPLDEIKYGKKELVLYFGRAQTYVKGTDAVIACAKNDPKRHYMLICSGSTDELKWHQKLLVNTINVTLSWEHNSKFVLGTVQLTENNPLARIYAIFLSRREPMGLVSREVILMQDNGSVLPIVSGSCGFDDKWQEEFSFVVTNPSNCEDDSLKSKENCNLAFGNDIFIHDDCIRNTLEALDKLSLMSLDELRKRVYNYKKAIKENYSQDRYWSFYLETISKILPDFKKIIDEKMIENKLQKVPNV
ncbi:MAG: hypothetical protein JXA54_02545 [Candidatus Heimdallarchaeota archaeon]|nr:hypothetical protein [Candidatus Heimdallarchaeota archaeon]